MGASTGQSLAEALEHFRAEPRSWYSEEHEYVGRGEARFTTNPGVIRGPAVVRFDRDGSVREFSIRPDELEADVEPPGGAENGMFMYVNGLPIADSPSAFSFGHNTCASVKIEGDGFNLSVDQDEILASGSNSGVTFDPYRTVAQFSESHEPHYWTAPLLNFRSKFFHAVPDLHDHPLRVRRSAAIDTQHDVGDWLREAYRQANALIPFETPQGVGFIEPLHDYEERIAQIDDTNQPIPTCVAVGQHNAEDDWFPADITTMLGLATGWKTAVPWVDIRDDTGRLIKRLHTIFGSTSPKRGRRLIDEHVNRSTGTLLTSWLTCRYRNESFLRVAAKHIVRAISATSTIDEQLSHLARAAECMCVGLKLNQPRPLEVSDDARKDALTALDGVADQLKQLASDHPQDRARLLGLRDRVLHVKSNSPSFTSQLEALIRMAELPDADWLADFEFRARSTGSPMAWFKAANKYRNLVFHDAFINFESGYDIDNTVAFVHHFSDVLVRVLFKLVGFDGRYQPLSGFWATCDEPVDWAQPDVLNPDRLRYRA